MPPQDTPFQAPQRAPFLVPTLVLTTFLAGLVMGRLFPHKSRSPAEMPAPATLVTPRAESLTTRIAETQSTSDTLEQQVRQAHTAVFSLAGEEERQRRLEKWAESDPVSALAFVHKELKGDRRAQAEAAILSLWGKSQPEKAWTWVMQNQPGATHHFDTLLESFGQKDPMLAARYAADFAAQHPSAAVEVHLAALLGITHEGNFTAARALVDNNPSLKPEERGMLLNFVAGQWARFEPEKAADWVLSLPKGPQRDQALLGLGESWSENNPRSAASFALQLPEGNTRQLALQQAISKWVLEEPAEASTWMLKNPPHADFDQAIASMATGQEFIQQHLELALTWADSIYNEELRSRSISEIIANWYALDHTGALQYLQNSANLSTEKRNELLRVLNAKSDSS